MITKEMLTPVTLAGQIVLVNPVLGRPKGQFVRPALLVQVWDVAVEDF
jgi:hypothetical protein